jgi:regulator of replication initiation timing
VSSNDETPVGSGSVPPVDLDEIEAAHGGNCRTLYNVNASREYARDRGAEAAFDAIPALVAEVRALRAENERLRSSIESRTHAFADQAAARESLRMAEWHDGDEQIKSLRECQKGSGMTADPTRIRDAWRSEVSYLRTRLQEAEAETVRWKREQAETVAASERAHQTVIDEYRRLQAERDSLRSQLAAAQAERDTWITRHNQEVAWAKTEKDKITGVIREVAAERDEQQRKAEDFEGRYETSHASRMHAEDCLRRVEQERDRAYKVRENFRARNDILTAERDSLRAQLAAVSEWAMVNEIADVPLDWAGLGAVLAGVVSPEPTTPEQVEQMCHWVQDREDCQQFWSHHAWHLGDCDDQKGVCPYFAVAEVMRGHNDPRESPVVVPVPLQEDGDQT